MYKISSFYDIFNGIPINDFFIGYEQYQQNLYLFKKLFIYSFSLSLLSSMLFIYNTKHPYIIFLKKIIYRTAFYICRKATKINSNHRYPKFKHYQNIMKNSTLNN